jgi:uncharacterized damage-inducible protein DinB
MKTTEFITAALEGGRMWMEALVADLDGADAVATPTSRGGNHALWVIGHLAVSEASILERITKGQGPAMEEWRPLFGRGSQPVGEVGKYPQKADLLAKYRGVRERTLACLKSLNETDLDRPTHAEGPPELFGTVGRCLATLVNHQTFHVGQIADVRRALGRKAVFG